MHKYKKILKFIVICFVYNLFSYYLIKNYFLMYGVNDDEFFSLLVQGEITGQKEWFTNIGESSPQFIFGILIYLLQKLNLQINIYSSALLFLVNLSISFLTYLITEIKESSTKILFIVFNTVNTFIIIFYFTVRPTYTLAAYILGFIGFICLAISLKKGNPFYTYISIVFIFLSYSIRRESLFISVLIFLPYIIYLIIFEKNIIKNLKKSIVISLLILFLGIFLNIFGRQLSLNHDDWINYLKFNDIRYSIQDNKFESYLSKDPEKYGLSKDTYQLFDSYLFVDDEIFNQNKLNLTKIKLSYENNIKIDLNIHKTLISTYKIYFPFLAFYLLTFVSILLIIKDKKFTYINLYFFTMNFFMIIFIITNLRMPDRVVFSTVISLSSGLYVGSIENRFSKNKSIIENISIGIIFLILTWTFIGEKIKLEYRFIKNPAYNSFWEIQKSVLKSFGKNAIFVGNFSSFKSNWTNPYFKYDDRDLKIIRYGWYSLSPYWVNSITKFNLEGINLKDFIYEKDVYFVGDKNIISPLNNTLKLTFNNSYFLNISTLEFDGSNYNIYKFYR